MELVFGLELKEVKPAGHSYTLVSSLDLASDGSVSSAWGFPQHGLLMPSLGVIFLNGNRASEEDVWEFLNVFGNLRRDEAFNLWRAQEAHHRFGAGKIPAVPAGDPQWSSTLQAPVGPESPH